MLQEPEVAMEPLQISPKAAMKSSEADAIGNVAKSTAVFWQGPFMEMVGKL